MARSLNREPSFDNVSAEREPPEASFTVMEKRHQRAALAALFERLVLATNRVDLTGKIHQDLPRVLESMLREFGGKVGALKEKILADAGFLATMYSVYLSLLSEKEKVEETTNTISADHFASLNHPPTRFEWGKKIFELVAGGPLRGQGSFEIKDGFVVMTFEEKEDYQYFLESIGSSAVVVEMSDGIFRSNFHFPGYKKMNLIVVNGSLRSQISSLSSLVAHEKQHFINSRLTGGGGMFGEMEDAFLHSENTSEEILGIRREERKLLAPIKDEVLAYLRDGTGGRDQINFDGRRHYTGVYAALQSDCYNPLFNRLPDFMRLTAGSCLRDISVEMELLRGLITLEERAVLVNHLVAVPLAEMAKYIKKVGVYYKKRLRIYNRIKGKLRDFSYPRLDFREEVYKIARLFESHAVDPRTIEDVVKQVRAVFDKYHVSTRGVLDLDFLSEV